MIYVSVSFKSEINFTFSSVAVEKNCYTLYYSVGSHVTHLEPLEENELNKLLGMVVDVENIFMAMHKEEDEETKRVYYYLFKVSACWNLPRLNHACRILLTLTKTCCSCCSGI